MDGNYFDNNEGLGGFESGGYDNCARHSCNANWTRQSRFSIPTNPKLLWKIEEKDALILSSNVYATFVVDRNKSVILTDCDNNVFSNHFGRLVRIDYQGNREVLFKTNRHLKSPVIGSGGLIYVCTSGDGGSTGHSLFCLFPDGNVKWEFELGHLTNGNPVLDKDGNIYVYTVFKRSGILKSIGANGLLNWEKCFESNCWYEPIVSEDGIVYIGLNSGELCAFDKKGDLLWKSEVGNAFGYSNFTIKKDGTIYVCFDTYLRALDKFGKLKWTYQPVDGNCGTSPAIAKDGSLYVILNYKRMAAIDEYGKELWRADLEGDTNLSNIVDGCEKIVAMTSMCYPLDISFVEVFTKEGEKLYSFTVEGEMVSIVISEDNLVYVLTHCFDDNYKGPMSKRPCSWKLYAIGQND